MAPPARYLVLCEACPSAALVIGYQTSEHDENEVKPTVTRGTIPPTIIN